MMPKKLGFLIAIVSVFTFVTAGHAVAQGGHRRAPRPEG